MGGWSGSVSLDDGVDTVTVTPTTVRSALNIWKALADAAEAQWPAESFTWGLSSAAGLLTLALTASRTLAFSGGLGALLGFAAGGSGTSFTAPSYARGLIGDAAVLYTDDVRQPMTAGVPGYGRVATSTTPGTELRTPRVEALVSPELLVQWQEDAEHWAYPGQVDIYTDPTTLTTAWLARYRAAAEGQTGYHRIRLSVVR